MRYSEMNIEQLNDALARVEADLANLGKEYDECPEYAFKDIDGELYNAKQCLGDQIYSCYSEIGYLNNRIKELSNG